MVNKCPLSFFVVNLIFVCIFIMFGYSHGNFLLSKSNLVTLIEKTSNFVIIPATTNIISNSTICWNVSKYKLTWLNVPRMDGVTLILSVLFDMTNQNWNELCWKALSNMLVFFHHHAKEFAQSVWSNCLFFSIPLLIDFTQHSKQVFIELPVHE
jgi:hypothetical protein